MNGTMLPQHVFHLFAREEVEAVLIGGLAAVLLGVPIVTGDMDFCYDPAPPNLSRLVRALAPLHPWLRVARLADRVARLADEEARALPFHWDERTLRDSPILTLQTDAGPLDLMDAVPGVGTYEEVRAMAVGVDVSGVRVMTSPRSYGSIRLELVHCTVPSVVAQSGSARCHCCMWRHPPRFRSK